MDYNKSYNSYKDTYDENYNDKYNDNFYSDEDYNDNYDKNEYIDYTDDLYDDLQPKQYKSISTIFDDGDESEDDDSSLMHTVDNDLVGYFSDARLGMPKKKMIDTMKKKPKRIIYKAGDQVIAVINRQTVKGIILFGPYESNKKQMYQLELESGEIAEAEERKLQNI